MNIVENMLSKMALTSDRQLLSMKNANPFKVQLKY